MLLIPKLKTCFFVAGREHGFRKKRSTTTILTELTTYISNSFNRTSRANVSHPILFRDILNSTRLGSIKRFVLSYIHNKNTFPEFKNITSILYKAEMHGSNGVFSYLFCLVSTEASLSSLWRRIRTFYICIWDQTERFFRKTKLLLIRAGHLFLKKKHKHF